VLVGWRRAKQIQKNLRKLRYPSVCRILNPENNTVSNLRNKIDLHLERCISLFIINVETGIHIRTEQSKTSNSQLLINADDTLFVALQ